MADNARSPLTPQFFATPAEFRAWFDQHHETTGELLVGFYKKGSGKPSITWPEAVDEALCVGWIDGVRKSIDGESYSIRFTPRKAAEHLEHGEYRPSRRTDQPRSDAPNRVESV